MKKRFPIVILVILAFLLILVLPSALYVVHPKEAVAVKQFGEIVKVEERQGLYVMIPFVQSTQRVSTALKLYDIPASDVITMDKKSMIADNYVLWRVIDPVKYIQTLGAIDARAAERIEAAVYNATKNTISAMNQTEVIAARGEVLTSKITQEANSDIGSYGIEVIVSEIKALDLPDDNKEAVYQRMISERQNIAAKYTAEGQEKAQRTRNETDREVAILKADAQRDAAKTIAEGEAQYMKILADAYNSPDKADFYVYLRSLDALKISLSGGNKTLILDKDSELAKILYGVSEDTDK